MAKIFLKPREAVALGREVIDSDMSRFGKIVFTTGTAVAGIIHLPFAGIEHVLTRKGV